MLASLKRTLRRRALRATVKRVKLDHLIVEGPCLNQNLSCNAETAPSENLSENGSALESNASDEEVGVGENDGDVNTGFVENDGDVNSLSNGSIQGCVDEHEENVSVLSEESGSDSFNVSECGSEEDVVQFASEREKEEYVIDAVREWAQKPGLLSMSKLDDLLHVLAVVFPRMPLSYKTLFQCDYDYDTSEFESGGSFWYKGIRNHLNQLNLKDCLKKYNNITLDVGIDGLPLDKVKLWPILGHLVGSENDPFIIGVYRGFRDPTDVREFLCKYIAELKDLLLNGFAFEGKVYEFRIRNYILDAPARQFVKCIVGHTGYCSCEKCTVYGEYADHRMTFLEDNATLRSDDSFQLREHPGHHKGNSPLEDVGTRMVSQFVLDPMHLVYAGVMKRLLEFWINVVGKWKLHVEIVDLISSIFEFLKQYCPSDFNRKPRSLTYLKSFKCTVLRRILLYDGIIAFKDLVDDNIYKNFLLLHCGIFILSSKPLISSKVDIAAELLRLFVSHSGQIYGSMFVVYNVHNLIHLSSECERLNMTLEEFSAFKFENKLKSIKETLKSGLHHLQQLARRDEEKKSDSVTLPSRACHVYLSLKNRLPFHRAASQHYKKLRAGKLILKIGKTDSCFTNRDGNVFVLHDIVKIRRKVHLFAVIKFFPSQEDENEYMEVGLTNWLHGNLNDDMVGQIYWPPPHKNATNLIKFEVPHETSWKKLNIKVMRFYDTFSAARAAVPHFLADSQYETETGEVPVTRKRTRNRRFISSDSDSDDVPVRKLAKTVIPAPPEVNISSNSRKGSNQSRKGGMSRDELKKQNREDLMARLKAAREAAAAKLKTKSPLKTPQKSPWKIAPLKQPNSKPVSDSVITAELSAGTDISPIKPLEGCENFALEMTESVAQSPSKNHDDNENPDSPDSLLSTPKIIDQQTVESSPTVRYFSQLPNNEAFCLSPRSAKSFTSNLLKKISQKTPADNVSRQLFSTESNVIVDKIKIMEIAIARLEVLSREISAKLDTVLMNVGRLKRTIIPGEAKIIMPAQMQKLPLETKDQLNQFESFLGESDLNLTAVCDHLSSYIRSSVADPERKSANAILQKLLYNNLAKDMNLEGGNGKISFRSLNLHKVFQGTLQSAFPKSDLSIALDALYRWLKDARWRKQMPSKVDNNSKEKQKSSSSGKK
ncbi:FAST kinase domain-containing protein 4 [Frankliniella fusca]|uniref:FAST kinase domain-containing protein 4 n=1 Tax=Frankliniella fusca TaxID=407009 RepID=A0AAE1I1F4_9NEOP|nr:FAST kinase domain-containing protein 4 [Frankliniella fusca]